MYVCMYVCIIYGIHHWTIFSEVAIESWPEWDLNPRPLDYTPLSRRHLVSGTKT